MAMPFAWTLGLIAGLAAVVVTDVSAESVWTDPFDAGAHLPWTSVRGDWTTTDGTYAAQQPGSSPVTATLLPYDLSDFSIEVDLVQPVDGGLWLRADAGATSGVLLVIFANRMYWHVIADPVAGPWTIHGFAWISPALGSGANRIRVTGHGPILRAYVNGASVATSTLDLSTVTNPPGTDFTRGRVGLYDNAAPGTRFDNVRLEAGTPVEVVAIGDVGNSSVRLFPIDADGDVTPIAVLSGAATGLADVRGIVIDGEYLRVSTGSHQAIHTFALGSLGNVAPIRSIQGANTGLGAVYHIAQVGQELFASSDSGPVSVFAADATGNVAPLRTIDAMTGAYAIDASLGELFVARHFEDPSSIYAYALDAQGGTPPLRHLSGATTNLGSTNLGLASTADDLFVADYSGGRIHAFARNADGDTAPLRTISGPTTGVAAAVDIGANGNDLFVANSGYGNVLVFPRAAQGNVAPSRVIVGPATGLSTPMSVAFGIYMIPDMLFANGFE